MVTAEPHSIRIAILHSSQLFRESLSCCLARVGTFLVVHAGSIWEGIEETLSSGRLDILMLEYEILCQGRGKNAARAGGLSSKVKTLVLDVPDREHDILYCIETGGASGYLTHNSSVEDLMSNIRAIVQGETLCSPRVASLTFDRIARFARHKEWVVDENAMLLTRRETEIVRLIEDGLSNKEIAARLQIEISTVKNHVHNILDKLHLRSRYSAVKYVKAQGLTLTRS